MAYTVAQNTSLLTAASIAQKVVSFIYFTVVARMIGVANTGQYFIAISFTTIFAVVADFGLAPILTRESAKYEQNTENFLNTVIGGKVFFGILAYALAILSAWLLNYNSELRLWIAISGITMFFDTLQGAFYGVLRAKRNLLYESMGIIASQLLTLIIGTIALLSGAPLYWLIIAYTIPSALSVIYSVFAVRRICGLRYRFTFDFIIFKNFIILAFPIALAGIIGRLYSYTDSILMSKMVTSQELGYWSVPYKITFAFQFIPAALSASVYPVMSILTLTDQKKIGELFMKSWRYLFLIVFPLVFGLGAIAQPVIIRLYGTNYLPSVPVLRILLASLTFSFLSIITGALLNATNHQKTQTGLLAVALVSNVILNLLLLPRYGIIGAAIAALSSNVILCGLALYFVARVVPINSQQLFFQALRILFPALLMGVAAYILAQYINFIIVILIALVLYVALLFVSKGMSKAFLYEIISKSSFKKQSL